MQVHLLDTACALDVPREQVGMPTWLGLLLATACGLIAANIYCAQPLVGPISTALLTMAAGLLLPVLALTYFLTETLELQP